MSKNRINNVLDRMVTARASRLPVASIQDFKMVDETVAQVIVVFSHNASKEQKREALANLLNGQASIVEDSFYRLNPKEEARAVDFGFVVANRISEELTDDRRKGMVTLADNCLMDSTDKSLWDVVEHAGRHFISRQENEDIAELLSNSKMERASTPTLKTVASCSPVEANYVRFVHAEEAALRSGYVVDSDTRNSKVLMRPLDTRSKAELAEVEIPNELIVRAASGVDVDNIVNQAVATLEDPQKLKDYYKKVYYYDPTYLDEVDHIIDQEAAL